VIHKWVHVAQDVQFGGPVVTYWGYHLERAIGRMSRDLTDRNRSALNLATNYMLRIASRNAAYMKQDLVSRGFDDNGCGTTLRHLFDLHPEVLTVKPQAIKYPPLKTYVRSTSPKKLDLTVEDMQAIASKFGHVHAEHWEVTKATINGVVYRTVGVEKFKKTLRSFCITKGDPNMVAKIHKFIVVQPVHQQNVIYLTYIEQFQVHRPDDQSVVPRIYPGSGIFTWLPVSDLGMQLAIGKKIDRPLDLAEYIIVPDLMFPLRPFDIP
jgi:hypothetical protein